MQLRKAKKEEHSVFFGLSSMNLEMMILVYAPQKFNIDTQKMGTSIYNKRSQRFQTLILGMLGLRGIRQIVSGALGQGIYLLAAKWENQALHPAG